jgi:hypothetical protein
VVTAFSMPDQDAKTATSAGPAFGAAGDLIEQIAFTAPATAVVGAIDRGTAPKKSRCTPAPT